MLFPNHRKHQHFLRIFIILTLYLAATLEGCSCKKQPLASPKQPKKEITSKPTPRTTSTSSTVSSNISSPPTIITANSKGIPNIGNSCYMNSTIQALKAFYPDLKNDSSSPFSACLTGVLNTLDDSTATATTIKQKATDFFNSFKDLLTDKGKEKEQQDASELLNHALHMANVPPLQVNKYLINPLTGEKRASTPDESTMLNLPLGAANGNKQSLQAIFDKELAPEPIEAKWDNSDTNQQSLIKEKKLDANVLKKLSVLPIHLGRFDNSLSKVSVALTNPFTLKIDKQYLDNATDSLNYELVGFIVHIGATLEGGHYVTYIKENNKWILYNDDRVSEASLETVKGEAETAYILFYKPV